jgi:hypothetical protein
MTCPFRLETADWALIEPPSFRTVAPTWEPGDTIPLGRRTLRVISVCEVDVDLDETPVLVVEDLAG